jgi:RHS repeat-associated protein
MTIQRRSASFLRSILVAAVCGLAAGPLAAGTWCGNPVQPCDPNNPLSSCYIPPQPDPRCEPIQCDKCTKSPCYTGTGVFTESSLDLSLPAIGPELVASRRYESSHMIDGPTGIGWTSSLAAHLYYTTYLFAAPSTYQKEADITLPTGGHYRFVDMGTGFTPPLGRHDTLVHNADGSFDLTLQRSTATMHFGADGSLQTSADEFGNVQTWTYDGNGRVLQVADTGSGRLLNVSWGGDGRISGVADSAGRQVLYQYDARGVLTNSYDALNRVTSYSYVAGRYTWMLNAIVDSWGRIVTQVTFDQEDRTHTYTKNGETYTYTYAFQGNTSQTAKADAAGNTWVYIYGPAGMVTDEVAPAGSGAATKHTGYYADGTIQEVIDEVGIATYLTYDTLGNVLTVTRDYQGPTAVTYDFAYDPAFPGRVISVTARNPGTGATDPTWQAWRYDYFQVGDPAPGALRHVFRVERDGATLDTVATYSYDSHGKVLSLADADGGTTSYNYDAQGNLASVTKPANNDAGVGPVVAYAYDAAGRITAVTDAVGSQMTYSYDALGRITAIAPPAPIAGSPLDFVTSFSYDNFDVTSGLVFTNTTDANGNVTKEGYDAHGRLGRQIDPLGAVTQYAYTRDRLTKLVDANGNAIIYAYDSIKRLSSMSFPDGSVEVYTYYGDGALASTTDRNHQTLNYTYDQRRRLSTKRYANSGGTITYVYSGQSLAEVVDTSVSPAETHTFSYDSAYRLAIEAQGGRGTLDYTYTPGDRRASDSVVGGQSSNYTYYPDGSLDTIAWSAAAGNFKFLYDLRGRYQQIVFPDGQSRSYTYDAQGRPIEVANVHPITGNLATFGYAYDVDNSTGLPGMLGPRSSMVADVPAQGLAGALTKYYYDHNYQLIRTDYPPAVPFGGAVNQWAYDLIGNRVSNTINGQAETYRYETVPPNTSNWNRLLSDGSNSYALDSNGNVLSVSGAQGAQTFSWDADNRAVRRSGTDVTTSTYDYRSRRATLTRNGQSSSFLYSEDRPLQAAGASAEAFVYGPLRDELLATYQNGVVYYAVADDHDSVVALCDASGTVHYSASYDAWGAIVASSGDLQSDFGYIGRQADSGGFWLNDARYYSPGIGRFLEEDPGGIDESTAKIWSESFDSLPPRPLAGQGRWERTNLPGINRGGRTYQYGLNNPVTFGDPGGQFWQWIAIPFTIHKIIKVWKCNSEYKECFYQCEVNQCNYCRQKELAKSGDYDPGCETRCSLSCNEKYSCWWDELTLTTTGVRWAWKWVIWPLVDI